MAQHCYTGDCGRGRAGFLLPGFSIMGMFERTERWKVVQQRTWLYCARLAAISVVAAGLLATAVYKGASMPPGA